MENTETKKATIWTRGYVCALLANVCLCFSQHCVNSLISTYATFLGASAVLVGTISGLYFGVACAARPISGPTIALVDKRKLMIWVYAAGVVTNLIYAVASKHFSTPYGELGGHAGYQYSVRKDYVINGPCVGVNWKPTWLQDKGILDDLNVIAEFDSRTLNLGCIATIWDGRFQAMFELQNLRWVNFGLRYQLKLKKIKVSEAPGWASYIIDI